MARSHLCLLSSFIGSTVLTGRVAEGAADVGRGWAATGVMFTGIVVIGGLPLILQGRGGGGLCALSCVSVRYPPPFGRTVWSGGGDLLAYLVQIGFRLGV